MAFERLMPGTAEWDMYCANHFSRYQFALDQLKRQNSGKILDAATGSGFGANFLSSNGIKEIIAIDRNRDAINYAIDKFQNQGIRFLVDDCEKFSNCKDYFPFDVVVSIETLEHLPHPEIFLRNCYQSLKGGGYLILSTPNKFVTSPGGIKNWEFHEKEYTPGGLIELLEQSGFSEIKMYGQQFTSIGRLRQEIRAELNTINFNPFLRMGRWFQKTLRGRYFNAVLPEKPEDFEIVAFPDIEVIEEKKINGPFVLIAVCNKPK